MDNIYAKEGTKVVFDNPNWGYQSHMEFSKSFLSEGQVYTVDYTRVGSWHSDVFLKEFPGKAFNTVQFTEVE